MTNRKLHTCCCLVAKSMTLYDLERPFRTVSKYMHFQNPSRKLSAAKVWHDCSFWQYKLSEIAVSRMGSLERDMLVSRSRLRGRFGRSTRPPRLFAFCRRIALFSGRAAGRVRTAQ